MFGPRLGELGPAKGIGRLWVSSAMPDAHPDRRGSHGLTSRSLVRRVRREQGQRVVKTNGGNQRLRRRDTMVGRHDFQQSVRTVPHPVRGRLQRVGTTPNSFACRRPVPAAEYDPGNGHPRHGETIAR